MSTYLSLVCGAVLVFLATNLDDLLLLVVLFSDSPQRSHPWGVLAGQILGFSCILLLSLSGYVTALVISSQWMSCLGFLPLFLGMRQLFRLSRSSAGCRDGIDLGFHGHPERVSTITSSWRSTAVKVAALTLANGSDNVSVYLPLFGRLSSLGSVITVITFFLALVVLWLLAQWLCHHKRWKHRLQALAPRLCPVVLIALGLWLLRDSVLATLF